MARFEYKKVSLKTMGHGVWSAPFLPDLEDILNREGQSGWRLIQIVYPKLEWAFFSSLVAILERETK